MTKKLPHLFLAFCLLLTAAALPAQTVTDIPLPPASVRGNPASSGTVQNGTGSATASDLAAERALLERTRAALAAERAALEQYRADLARRQKEAAEAEDLFSEEAELPADSFEENDLPEETEFFDEAEDEEEDEE